MLNQHLNNKHSGMVIGTIQQPFSESSVVKFRLWQKSITQPSTTSRRRRIGFFMVAAFGMVGVGGVAVVVKKSDPKTKIMIMNKREYYNHWQVVELYTGQYYHSVLRMYNHKYPMIDFQAGEEPTLK